MVGLESHGDVVLQVQLGLGVVLARLEVDDEIVLDGENGVVDQMRVVVRVDLVDDGAVIRVGDHEMDVGRAPWGAVHEVQQDTGGTVGGQRVSGRVVAVPPELALLVGPELAAKVVDRLVVRVLEIVLAVGRGLPDVENGAGNGLPVVHVTHDTVHVGDLANVMGVLDGAVAELAEGSVGRPEGAKDGGGGGRLAGLGDDLVCDLVDKASQWISF